jgi:alkylhydroperoxidase family enzyme
LTDLIAARCPGATFGFSDEDVWDIAEVAAMFNFTNRLAGATGQLPNREYNGIAR